MASTMDLFVGAEATLSDLRNVLEAAVGAPFKANADGELVVPRGSARLFLNDGHEFDDEEIRWPDGTWIKLHSEYRYWIEIRDVERDEDRQLEVAKSVFQALTDFGRCRLVLIYDMQRLVSGYEPQAG
jgi:hypothetical protein